MPGRGELLERAEPLEVGRGSRPPSDRRPDRPGWGAPRSATTTTKPTTTSEDPDDRPPPGVVPGAQHLVVRARPVVRERRASAAVRGTAAAGSRVRRRVGCWGYCGGGGYAGGGGGCGSVTAASRLGSRARDRSRPSSSSDSKSGGEMRRPVIATRTGPNALRGLSPSPSMSAVAQRLVDRRGVPGVQRRQRVVAALTTCGPRRCRAACRRRPGRARSSRRRTGSRACRRDSPAWSSARCTSGCGRQQSRAAPRSTSRRQEPGAPAR